ncbi:hypothetical protein [Sphingobacterium sp. SYP-B4668]|uniref:hypothetical protein n=1 Tax=Sphingobacterium sp. SYP-B4668 TaxID=2996035 RepID=UPI0022DD34BC|nr:hypothetical protein [Sphingobacterium sp. SYP-B4668]
MIFASCSTSDDNGFNDDGNDGNGGNPTSISYWRYAIGNKWNMTDLKDAKDTYTYHIYKKINHGGKTYFQVEPIGLNEDIESTDGFREDNGVFTSLHGATSMNGVNTSAGVMKSMDTNLKVGEVWEEEMTLTISGVASGIIKHTNYARPLSKGRL